MEMLCLLCRKGPARSPIQGIGKTPVCVCVCVCVCACVCVCVCLCVSAPLDYKMPVVMLYKAKKSGLLKRCLWQKDVTPLLMQSCSACACACSGGLTLARLCKEGRREDGRSDLHFKSPVKTSSVCLPLLQAIFMILSLTLQVKTGFFFGFKQPAPPPLFSRSLSPCWDKPNWWKVCSIRPTSPFDRTSPASFSSLSIWHLEPRRGQRSRPVAALLYLISLAN